MFKDLCKNSLSNLLTEMKKLEYINKLDLNIFILMNNLDAKKRYND